MIEISSKQSILVIDDAPTQLAVLSRMLSSKYNVLIAKTGEEGLKLIEENKVDLVILDLYMPGMSGFAVLARLKKSETTKHIPVIIITSSTANEDEAKGLAFGAADYMRKPFTESVVKLRVDVHLRLINQAKIIENLSLADTLTGIGNRRSFEDMAKSMWSFARRTKDYFAVLLTDIDKFRHFNDKHGHVSGDICLKIVVESIRNSLRRGSDSMYRWGGDEFAILLPGITLGGAMFVAENIRENVASTPIKIGTKADFVTVSTGVGSISPIDADFEQDFVDFFASINGAVRRAKESGGNRVERI